MLKRQETAQIFEMQRDIEVEEENKFNLESQLSLLRKNFRIKYLSHDVFVHLCNGCKKHSMLLNKPNCLLCEKENPYYDPEILVDPKLDEEIFSAIIGLETEDANNIANL